MLIVFIVVSFCLAAIFGLLWINSLLGTKRQDEERPYLSPEEHSMGVMKIPDSFDVDVLKNDLARLADTPTLFEQYVQRARHRFTKRSQIKALERWIHFYDTGTRALTAKTKFGRAGLDDRLLDKEERIAFQAKDTELARLEADQEEHITRRVRAVKAREALDRPPPLINVRHEDDLKMEAAQEFNRRNIAFDIRIQAGKKLTTLKELQRWFKEERNVIFHDDSLSEDEQNEQYNELRTSLNEYKRHLREDIDPYEDE